MDRDLARPRHGHALRAASGASVNMPPATHTTPGRRLAALLAEARDLRAADLERTLATWTVGDVAEALRFSPDGYARTLLAETPTAEILVLGWLPGQGSPVHGHGESHGIVHVLSGTGTEESYHLEGGELVAGARRDFRAGDALRETPGSHHRVWNSGDDLLVTLHSYSPKLPR